MTDTGGLASELVEQLHNLATRISNSATSPANASTALKAADYIAALSTQPAVDATHRSKMMQPDRKQQLLDLAERVGRAEASEQRELLTTAFALAFPDNYMEGRSGIGLDRWSRFRRMLEAEAYESAALTLADGLSEVTIWQIWNEALTECSKAEADLVRDVARFWTAAALRACAALNQAPGQTGELDSSGGEG